jgi:AhpD family alkylhydroperoxidase
MKQYLEDMKQRRPRIPLPDLSEAERAQQAERGERSGGYEGRLRALYMPAGEGRGDFGFSGAGGRSGTTGDAGRRNTGAGSSREPDPNMTLDYKFKTQLFWIVSRSNNCQYCLGHQESKLLAAGMTEDEIAALDFDWTQFEPAEQAAFAFARRFTYEPHRLADSDIEALRMHYTDLQILEMILSMAGNNSINRWKEGVGVPQSESGGGFGSRRGDNSSTPETTSRRHSYLTPTSSGFQNMVTKVAPLVLDTSSHAARQTVCSREIPSRAQAEELLAAARKRTPRLPLVDENAARSLLPETWTGPVPQWVRLLANFSSKSRISNILSADERGDLSPLLKAQVSWIIARQDSAWYALGLAKKRLEEFGYSDDQIYELDGNWESFRRNERAMFTVVRNLAASPVVLTDEQVDEAVRLAGPRDVVQLISYTTGRASFNRITEAAGLQLEP